MGPIRGMNKINNIQPLLPISFNRLIVTAKAGINTTNEYNKESCGLIIEAILEKTILNNTNIQYSCLDAFELKSENFFKTDIKLYINLVYLDSHAKFIKILVTWNGNTK